MKISFQFERDEKEQVVEGDEVQVKAFGDVLVEQSWYSDFFHFVESLPDRKEEDDRGE